MSLSKFYNNSSAFKAKSVLDKNAVSSAGPVWGSIVKNEEPGVQEDNVAEESFSDTVATELIPEQEPLQETTIETQIIDEVPPVEPPPDNAPPEVSVDIAIIEQNAFASGIEAGKKQAEEDFENSAQTLLCICSELDTLRETILRNSSGEMKELVIAISEKIIKHSVAEQEETIVATIKDAINLAVNSDEFEIQINPDDLSVVEKFKQEIIDSISGLNNIVLRPDPTLERGGCKLESSSCTVDASMISQIKVIHDSIMAAENLSELTKNTEPEDTLIEE